MSKSLDQSLYSRFTYCDMTGYAKTPKNNTGASLIRLSSYMDTIQVNSYWPFYQLGYCPCYTDSIY